jgi:AcrR family transcriptional regulator
MPKQTFFNLPDEKRAKIIDAAIEEFAANGYAQTSINSIVERAEIAKGSIYQYFEDKKDFYIFLVSFVKEFYMTHRAEFVGDVATQPFREILLRTMLFFREFQEKYPAQVRFYFAMVGDTSIPFDEEISRIMTEPSLDYMRGIIKIAQKRGEIRPEIDMDMLVFDLVVLITGFQQATVSPAMGDYYGIDGEREKVLRENAESLLDIVFYGIATR